MSKLLIATLMLATAPAVFADQAPTAPRAGARLGSQRPASDPYRKLFEPQKSIVPSMATQQPAARPRIVCGMTIIPADPAIDPKMLVTPQKDGVDYTLRVIDPPICLPAH